MKHDIKITALLLAFFILAQITGLFLINLDMKELKTEDGITKVVHDETSLGPRPEMSGLGAFAYVIIGISVGTLIILLIIKTNKINLWKAWFFLAIFMAMSLSLGVFIKGWLVFVIAFALAVIKVLKPNVIIHNVTEIMMYSGLAIFLVPLLNVFWMIMLLLAISVYDFIAVFKSKHMVTMAKFQTKSNLFAGLFIPYHKKEDKSTIKFGDDSNNKTLLKNQSINSSKRKLPVDTIKSVERKNAVLGGGDIAFPLIFTGCVMESLIANGVMKITALYQSLVITVATTIALALLFIFAKKDKFYPAMPIITAGCLIGYLILIVVF